MLARYCPSCFFRPTEFRTSSLLCRVGGFAGIPCTYNIVIMALPFRMILLAIRLDQSGCSSIRLYTVFTQFIFRYLMNKMCTFTVLHLKYLLFGKYNAFFQTIPRNRQELLCSIITPVICKEITLKQTISFMQLKEPTNLPPKG